MTTWPAEFGSGPPPVRPVLVIEDNRADAVLLEIALAEMASGVQVVMVSDGPTALSVLQTLAIPPVVVLNLHLLGEESLEVLRAIRVQAGGAVWVVCWSSHAHPNDVAAAYGEGADQYVEKPASLEGFFAFAQQLLSL